jgi:hypothetical protein
MMEDKAKTPTIKSDQSVVSGTRTVNIGIDYSDQWGQEKQLIACMSDNVDRLLPTQFHISQDEHFAIDGGDVSGIEKLKGKEDGIIIDDISWTLVCSGLDAGLN